MGMDDKAKVINVPLDADTAAALEARADANGRATRREAAAIIERAVKPRRGGAE